MAKYIDREQAFKALLDRAVCTAYEGMTAYDVKLVFGDLPNADVQEVKHGQWLRTDSYPHKIYCSNCYATYIPDEELCFAYGLKLRPFFCNHCGAVMDGGKEQ